MNAFIIFAAVIAAAVAGPVFPVSVSQDTLGNYKVAYTAADSSRSEESLNGQVHGSYAFVDKETGAEHKIYYLAGRQGYLAEGASIPKPVSLTPEVAHAAHEHRVLYAEIAKDLPVLPLSETDPTAVHHEHEHFVHVVPVIEHELPVYHHELPSAPVYHHEEHVESSEEDIVAAIKAVHAKATHHAEHFNVHH